MFAKQGFYIYLLKIVWAEILKKERKKLTINGDYVTAVIILCFL